MALDQSALLDALRTADGGELMRRMQAMMLQELIDAEATAMIDSGLDERAADRTILRNGTRDKLLTTGSGM